MTRKSQQVRQVDAGFSQHSVRDMRVRLAIVVIISVVILIPLFFFEGYIIGLLWVLLVLNWIDTPRKALDQRLSFDDRRIWGACYNKTGFFLQIKKTDVDLDLREITDVKITNLKKDYGTVTIYVDNGRYWFTYLVNPEEFVNTLNDARNLALGQNIRKNTDRKITKIDIPEDCSTNKVLSKSEYGKKIKHKAVTAALKKHGNYSLRECSKCKTRLSRLNLSTGKCPVCGHNIEKYLKSPKCSSCGVEINLDDNYCRNCGNRLGLDDLNGEDL